MTRNNQATIYRNESDELHFLRDLLRYSPDVICTLDDDGRFLFVSAAAATLWGYSQEEITGFHFIHFILEEDQPASEAAAARVKKEGEIIDFENRYRCKNGGVMPMLWRARWDAEKQVIIAVGRDNTERKKIAQQMALQDRNLRRAYQVANLAWWEFDATGQKFLCSEEMFQLLGLQVPAEHELPLPAYLSLLHPDDRLAATNFFCNRDYVSTFSPPGNSFHLQHRLLKPSGDMITVSQTAERIHDEEGKVTGFHGTAQDITESQYYHQLEKLEREVLEMNAWSGRSMQEMLAVYMNGIEALHYGMYCTIMEVRGEQLYTVAAPNMPQDFLSTIEGIPVSDNIGSCGTAAFRKEKIIVTDILTDSRWASHLEHAARHNLLACWSLPILDSNGVVLATFGCYYKQSKAPSAREENTIQRTGHILKIIFESYHREKALRESNQRFEMVTRATNDAIWDLDIERDETTWGEGFNTLFGHDHTKKIVGSDAVFSFVHPDDVPRLRDSLARALESGITSWAEEFRFRKADGTYVHIIDKAVLIRDESGKPVRMVGAAQDITARKLAEEERRLSEEQYRLLFHKSPIPKIIFEPQSLKVVSANEAAEQTYGYAITDLLKLTMLDLVAEEEHACFAEAFKDSCNITSAASGYSRHRKKDGTLFYVDMCRQELSFRGKRHFLVSAIDMTEKLRLQQKLIEEKVTAQKEVARIIIDTQEKERSVIGKELHDNVNQLLTTAKLYVENIKHLPAQVEMFTDKSISLLLRAINEIRFLSRQLVTPVIHDIGFEATLAELKDHYLSLGRFDMELKTCLREDNLSEELKLTLYRIVQEQLNNIVKYAQATHVKVLLLQEDDHLRLQVADNGVGFDPQKTARGLGLRNIRNRADAYKGTVTIESAPGQGCQLLAEFPLGEAMS